MKKTFLFLGGIILFSSITFVACKKTETQPQNGASNVGVNETTPSNRQVSESVKPKLKFKHTKMGRPGDPNPPSCAEPFGMCIIFGAQAVAASHQFDAAERAESVGTAKFEMVDGAHMKMIPDTKFAYPDGTIELDNNMPIDHSLSKQLGYNVVIIKKGKYQVNPNEGDFGSVIVDVKSN